MTSDREAMKMFVCYLYQERFCEPIILPSTGRKIVLSA